ncbi:MAG TPA: hypothetical protein VGL37_06020 [Solirubrobacteraceae bacterium]|jgi:hypothetical protein
MQNDTVLPIVVFGATAVYVISGLLSMLSRPNLYDQIGQGGLSTVSEDRPGGGLPDRALGLAAAEAERELEVRQMLDARSNRLVRQGAAPLDVDAELRRLEHLAAIRVDRRDEDLVEEVRHLTIVRNERRARQGLEGLDIETEIERVLVELDYLHS